MVAVANDDDARSGLRLEVTFQAEVLVALHEHFFVGRAMWIMAGGAAFANGLMLKNEGATLSGMALHAGVALRRHGCAAAFNARSFVRVMAVAAGNASIFNRMMVRGGKAGFHVHVACHAGF